MNKIIFKRCLYVMAIAISILSSSCQKDVLDAPETTNETKPMLIFIRAVDKDSSSISSEQILLR